VIFSEHFGENYVILLQTVAKWRYIKLGAIFARPPWMQSSLVQLIRATKQWIHKLCEGHRCVWDGLKLNTSCYSHSVTTKCIVRDPTSVRQQMQYRWKLSVPVYCILLIQFLPAQSTTNTKELSNYRPRVLNWGKIPLKENFPHVTGEILFWQEF